MCEKSTILNSQYRIITRIGQGTFGQVYLAHDLLKD